MRLVVKRPVSRTNLSARRIRQILCEKVSSDISVPAEKSRLKRSGPVLLIEVSRSERWAVTSLGVSSRQKRAVGPK